MSPPIFSPMLFSLEEFEDSSNMPVFLLNRSAIINEVVVESFVNYCHLGNKSNFRFCSMLKIVFTIRFFREYH